MSKIIIHNPPKYTKAQKKVVVAYLEGKESNRSASKKMGYSTTKLYTELTSTLRHAVINGKIDVEEIFSN